MQDHFPKFPKPYSEEPSYSWVRDFMNRTDVVKRTGNSMELPRLQMGTTGNISSWFQDTYMKIDLTQYNSKLICNCDESMLETKAKTICVVRRFQRYAIIPEMPNGEHITILTMVTTNGDTCPPLMIFPLKTLPTQLSDLVTNDRLWVGGQESGWIDQVTFLDWAKKYCGWMKNRRIMLGLVPNARGLLFLDSHSSRSSSEVLNLFKENFIDVVSFPAHTSHLLHPLDVAIFGAFKKYFKFGEESFTRVQLNGPMITNQVQIL